MSSFQISYFSLKLNLTFRIALMTHSAKPPHGPDPTTHIIIGPKFNCLHYLIIKLNIKCSMLFSNYSNFNGRMNLSVDLVC